MAWDHYTSAIVPMEWRFVIENGVDECFELVFILCLTQFFNSHSLKNNTLDSPKQLDSCAEENSQQ
jgi:hypothetical protein